MSVITLFNGLFCNASSVAQNIVGTTGYMLITDDIIINSAAELSGISAEKIKLAFSPDPSAFNPSTQEKERLMAYLKLASANLLDNQNLIIQGFSSLFIPKTIPHVLKVCLIEKTSCRSQREESGPPVSGQDISRKTAMEDHERSQWTKQLFNMADPWDTHLYDLIIPMDQTTPEKAGATIKQHLLNDLNPVTDFSKQAVNDFKLASSVEVSLVNAGHKTFVEAKNGKLILRINQPGIMAGQLENQLKSIVADLPGVISVDTKIGQSDQETHVYQKFNIDFPPKVLLVDDERQFVQTLSERLQMRKMGTIVAYDGPSAIDRVENDNPDVMIVDLRLPGMDGMEILSRIKQMNPKIEIIMLTGHGSEKDRKKCLSLGAFAYMQKPVGINILCEKLKQAHEKARS